MRYNERVVFDQNPKPPPTGRRPLSLRDLFCLTTLLCAGIVLVRVPVWDAEEHWLLGLAMFGTLLGILAGRSLKWPAWPLGLTVGTLGAVLGTGLNYHWLRQATSWYGTSLRDAVAQAATATLFLGGGIAGLIVVGTLLGFWLLSWLASERPSGALAQFRKHPILGGSAFLTMAALVWCVARFDQLLWPDAWPVGVAIPFQRNGQRLDLQSRVIDLALSRDGRYLAVSFDLGDDLSDDAESTPFIGHTRRRGATWAYELINSPRRIELPGIEANRWHQVAFDCESDRLALLQRNSYAPLLIVDVSSGKAPQPLTNPDPGNNWSGVSRQGRIQWLPGNQLAMDGNSGSTPLVLDVSSGQRSRTESIPAQTETVSQPSPMLTATHFEPRLGHEYRFEVCDLFPFRCDTVSVFDIANQGRLFQMRCNIFPTTRNCVVSSDGKYLLYESMDDEGLTLYTADARRCTTSGTLWTFNSRSQVLCSTAVLDQHGMIENTWVDFVPFLRCGQAWRQRDCIALLDPDSGRELARTQPISPCILNVVLSHDGSTMAVATWEGVYVFNVPAEFR